MDGLGELLGGSSLASAEAAAVDVVTELPPIGKTRSVVAAGHDNKSVPSAAPAAARRRSLVGSQSMPELSSRNSVPSRSRVLYSRGSLSRAVQVANSEVGFQFGCLTSLERQRGSVDPSSSAGGSGRSGATVLPPIAQRGTDILDDIRGLLKDATKVYGEMGGPSESKAAARAAARADADGAAMPSAPPPPPAKRKAKPKRRPKADGEDMLSATRSESSLYVRNMLRELRDDPYKREQFDDKVTAFVRARGPPPSDILKQNITAVAKATPASILEARRSRSLQRIERERERHAEVLERRDEAEERRIQGVHTRAGRWENEHAERVARERAHALRQRQAAWLAVLTATLPGLHMGVQLADHRVRFKELQEKLSASKSFVMMWRIYIMRKRLKALTTVRRLMRRQFFFYRMGRRIKQKRKATATIIDYLQSLQAVSKPHKLIRRYAWSIKRIQANWKRTWMILSTQMHVVGQRWIEADTARGMSKSAAVMNEAKEREHRLEVIRDDLRERKAAHLSEMLKYRKVKREYDEWREQQDIMEEARLLAGGQKVGTAADRINVQEQHKLPAYRASLGKPSAKVPSASDERQPPPRPFFAIAGPAGHFVMLAERVRRRQAMEHRAKDKEWAEADKQFMEEMAADSQNAPPSQARAGARRQSLAQQTIV